eukprot:5942212-Prymnesium_polylepis.1
MRRAAGAVVAMHEDGASSPLARSPSKRDRDDDEDGVTLQASPPLRSAGVVGGEGSRWASRCCDSAQKLAGGGGSM